MIFSRSTAGILFSANSPKGHEQVWDFYDFCNIFAMVNRTIEEKENTKGLLDVFKEAAARAKPVITRSDGGSKEAV